MKREILRIQKLYKYSKGKLVLNNFCMNLYEGDILGIIGLHDSGKSSLLNILDGKESWDTGNIFYDEETISPTQLKKINKIQLVRNEPMLVPFLSVLENIFIIRRHSHFKFFINWRLLKKQLIQHFAEFGINIDYNQDVSSLSLAEQHLIEIMKAYILGAKIILIDNIMAQYTSEELLNFQQVVNKLKQKNVSFIITGYQLALLQRYVDKILFLDKGTNVKVFQNINNLKINEKQILLGNISSDNKPPFKRIFDEIAFEAYHISTHPGEDISFKINRGDIAVILDFPHSTNENIIKAIRGNVKYNGFFRLGGKTIRNITQRRSSVCIADYEMGDIAIRSLDLKDNLCLSVFPRISHLAFFSIRQRKQIMTDFLKLYHDSNFEYEFDIQNLSQSETIAIYLYRILIQKWNLLLCTNSEILFSYETVDIIKDQLRRMTENGRTICIFASTIEQYADLADYYYIVENGKIQGKYTYQECLQHFSSHDYRP